MWLFLYITYEYEQYQKDVDDERQLLRVLGLVVVQTVPVPTTCPKTLDLLFFRDISDKKPRNFMKLGHWVFLNLT